MIPRTGEIKDYKEEVEFKLCLKGCTGIFETTRMVEHTRWLVQTWEEEFGKHA